MTKFDTNGLTERLRETEAAINAILDIDSHTQKRWNELVAERRRLERILESADSLGPDRKGPASEASVVAHGSDQLAQWFRDTAADLFTLKFPSGSFELSMRNGLLEHLRRCRETLESNNASSCEAGRANA